MCYEAEGQADSKKCDQLPDHLRGEGVFRACVVPVNPEKVADIDLGPME